MWLKWRIIRTICVPYGTYLGLDPIIHAGPFQERQVHNESQLLPRRSLGYQAESVDVDGLAHICGRRAQDSALTHLCRQEATHHFWVCQGRLHIGGSTPAFTLAIAEDYAEPISQAIHQVGTIRPVLMALQVFAPYARLNRGHNPVPATHNWLQDYRTHWSS